MRKIGRKCMLLSFIIALCLLSVPLDGHAAEQAMAGFDKAAENEFLILYDNPTNGEIAVESKKSGYVWRSNPVDADKDQLAQGVNKIALSAQLLVGYVDKSLGEVTLGNVFSSIKKKGMKIEKIADGIKFVFRFPDLKIAVPVQYSLSGDSFQAEIVTSEIVEEDDNKVLNLSLLPFFGAGGARDDGYMMVPDGSGALIRFNNGKTNAAEYDLPVYGRDAALHTVSYQYASQDIKMPVYGVKNGEHAFLAVIAKGDGDAAVQAAVSGMKTSFNNVYAKFQYRDVEKVSFVGSDTTRPREFKVLSKIAPSHDPFEVRYYLLEGDQADYSGMAQRYQQYMIREDGLAKTVSNGDYPLYVEAFGGVQKKKYMLGIPYHTVEPLTTYNQAKAMLGDIKQHGIDDVVFKYTGWTANGIRDKTPTKVSFESKLGGEKGFRDLAAYTKTNQIRFFPSVDFLSFYKNGNGLWSFNDTVKDVNSAPSFQYRFMLNLLFPFTDNRWYMLKPGIVERSANKFINSYRKLAIPGLALDTIGNTLYSDFSKNGVNRSDGETIWKRTIHTLQNNTGSILVDNANAYAFPSANYIMNAPVDSDQQDITDEDIPFYQMAIHGFISYSLPNVNLADDPEEMVLKAAETGSSLSYSWIGREDVTVLRDTPLDGLFSANYRPWLDTAANDYKKLNAALAPLADKRITAHRQIDSNLVETSFEDGTKIIVNYNRASQNVNGKTVGARDFLVVKE